MLYPKISNIKKNHIAIRILVILSIILSLICIIINRAIDKKVTWSLLAVSGIIYCWITVLYSIQKNTNIAMHVMVQAICMAIFSVIVDQTMGYQGWSVNFAIPIIIAIANITMMILLAVSKVKYLRYMIYQIIIFIVSLIPILLYLLKIEIEVIPTVMSIMIAGLSFLTTVLISGKDMKNEIERRFSI